MTVKFERINEQKVKATKAKGSMIIYLNLKTPKGYTGRYYYFRDGMRRLCSTLAQAKTEVAQILDTYGA